MAVFVPIECVHNNDYLSFVYMDRRKRQVITGKSNDEDIVVRRGLKKGDEISLYLPKRAEKWRLRLLAK